MTNNFEIVAEGNTPKFSVEGTLDNSDITACLRAEQAADVLARALIACIADGDVEQDHREYAEQVHDLLSELWGTPQDDAANVWTYWDEIVWGDEKHPVAVASVDLSKGMTSLYL